VELRRLLGKRKHPLMAVGGVSVILQGKELKANLTFLMRSKGKEMNGTRNVT
jgi:hypothetical protein